MIKFLINNLPTVRQFPGCLYVDVLFDENQQEMLLDEQWQSITAHKDYIKFITDNDVLNQLAAFLERPPAIKYFFHEEI